MSRATSRSLTTVGQRFRWTVTPLPRVMKPTIGSPGDRVAALAEADEQVADSLDPDAAGACRRGRGDRQGQLAVVIDDAEPHDDRWAEIAP